MEPIMKGPWSTWSMTNFAATRAGARPGRMRSMTLNQYVSSGPTCVKIKILRRVRAESSRRPPRHRRDACSMAW
jgi:hypothetical protein